MNRAAGERRMTDRVVEPRLERMEGKIDRLTEAMVTFHRLDERITTLFSRMAAYDSAQAKEVERVMLLHERIVEVEKKTLSIPVLQRVAYALASAMLASLFWYVQGGGV